MTQFNLKFDFKHDTKKRDLKLLDVYPSRLVFGSPTGAVACSYGPLSSPV